MKKIFIKLLILILIMQVSFNLIDTILRNSKAATKIYLKEGETTTIVPTTSNYTLSDPSIADVIITETVKANLGTNSSYTGTEVTLESCEYTWEDAGRENGTYYATRGSLYLFLNVEYNTSYVNYNSQSPLTVTNNNGDFTAGYVNPNGGTSYYLSFNTTNSYFTATTSSASKTTFNLYRAVKSGETASTEIPGYIKVTQIEEGEKYLIVKANGGNYYVLYPKQRTNSNYDETAKVNNTPDYSCNITGKSSGTTTLTIGDDEYTIIVYDENEEIEIEPSDAFEDKGLIISKGLTYTIQKNTTETVTWTSSNTSIARINTNGRVTAVAEGSTTIKATVGGVTYTIPVTVTPQYTTSTSNYNSRLINIHLDSDDETTTYYNYSHGVDFVKMRDGTRVYLRVPRNSNNYTNFYSVPDEGYALSYMSGWYAPIVEETESEVENGNGPYIFATTQARYFRASDMSVAVETAYSKGAEGMFGYSTAAAVTQTLTVRSEKLPTISQKVYSINGENYNSGDVAYPGDTVIFEVTVSKKAYDYIVNYEGTLTSNLNGAVFLGTSPSGTGTSTSQAVSISTTNAYSQKYYIKYVIPENTTQDVTNTVTFNYESYGNPSSTDRTGYVDSTASYKTDRTGNASATVDVEQKVVVQNTYITITKNVAGNMRENDKYFKFLVTIDGTSGDTYRIAGQDSTITYNGTQITTSSTYTVGSTNYVYLKAGQVVRIGLAADGTTTQIPEGITYSIVEQDAEDYITTIQGIQGETKTTGNLTTAATNTIQFLNSKDAAAMTNQYFEVTAYLLVFSFGVIFIALIKRQNKYK